MGILLSFHWGREQQLRQRVQFIYPHLFPGSCLSSCPGSLLIADLNADQTLFFLEPSVVGGTASLLGNVGSESGAEDGEGNEVDDRGECFWFSGLFFVFSLVSFHFSLCYLVFLHFCFRSFDLSFFTFTLRASFWSWLVLVEHLLCRSFLRLFLWVFCIWRMYPSGFNPLSLAVLELWLGISGLLVCFSFDIRSCIYGSICSCVHRGVSLTPRWKAQPFVTLVLFSLFFLLISFMPSSNAAAMACADSLPTLLG